MAWLIVVQWLCVGAVLFSWGIVGLAHATRAEFLCRMLGMDTKADRQIRELKESSHYRQALAELNREFTADADSHDELEKRFPQLKTEEALAESRSRNEDLKAQFRRQAEWANRAWDLEDDKPARTTMMDCSRGTTYPWISSH